MARGSNFYNLPSPWNPGYAIPEYIEAEGLQNNTFTTKWEPRGTYDAPKVGTGGYVLPKYMKSEQYGQGSRTTAWARRGTAPNVPDYMGQPTALVAGTKKIDDGTATAYQLDVLGDDSGFAHPLDAYGLRAADTILANLNSVPVAQRKDALKALLDAVDPSLWNTIQNVAAGMRGLSAKETLRRAMAQSMSKGIANEFINIAKKGAVPRKGQAGLGHFGCMGLAGFQSAMGSIIGDIGSFVKSVGKQLEPLACTAAAATSSIGAASVALGPAAIAATVGASIANGVCPQPKAPVPPPAVAPPPYAPPYVPPVSPVASMLPWLLVGGAGLAAVFIVTSGPKKAAT